ncbi:MAG: hypothetical protein HQL23_07780 [Candidatus Omnitrophica bacterium]|nr:hypothetical protein [Candidatus Omnitrophota bacterium]
MDKKGLEMMNRQGQNAIEYMLLFAAATMVLLVALRPGGFFTQAINHSMETALVNGLDQMASGVYYNVYNEPGTKVCREVNADDKTKCLVW